MRSHRSHGPFFADPEILAPGTELASASNRPIVSAAGSRRSPRPDQDLAQLRSLHYVVPASAGVVRSFGMCQARAAEPRDSVQA